MKRNLGMLLRRALMAGLAFCWLGSGAMAGANADAISAKIDTEYALAFMKEISLLGSDNNVFGFAAAGSTGEKKIADRIAEEMRSIGMQDVAVEEFSVDAWEFNFASLQIIAPTLSPQIITLSAYAGSVGTEGVVSAEIVDVGRGDAAGYEGKDVKGKIVLATFDPLDDFWFGPAAHQAEVRGACAILISYSGENYGVRPDALNTFDGQIRTTIPVLNMSRQDAEAIRGLQATGPVSAKLDVDIVMDLKTGKGHNAVGVIPGKHPDQYIILASHLDSYFNAYIDNKFGVATTLALAKAILDSGYKPDKTIVIIAHGAEEYGVTGKHYDWCIGSWHAVNTLHPEWAFNTMAILNTDAVRPDAPAFRFNGTPELHTYLNQYITTLKTPPATPYKEGFEIKGLNGPWSDDYNYALQGIPAVICGRGPSEWKVLSYHTQFDTYSNEYMGTVPDVLGYCVYNYIHMLYALDRMAVAPLNFQTVMAELKGALDVGVAKAAGHDASALVAAADKLDADSAKNYALITEANALYARIIDALEAGAKLDMNKVSRFSEDLKKQNANVLKMYKLMQGDLMKLDKWDCVFFAHELIQTNYTGLLAAIDALQAKDAEAALKELNNVDFTLLARDFDKEVYEFAAIQAFDPSRDDLYWGTGKVLPQLDTYDVYQRIRKKAQSGSKDYGAEIKTLRKMVAFEADLFGQSIEEQKAIITAADGLIDAKAMNAAIELGRSILQ